MTSTQGYMQSSQYLIDYQNYFKVCNSPYSSAFALLDTMDIPRPCAEASVNLTHFTYFYCME